MKKIIVMALAAITMVSASFALNLSLGVRANLGKNLDNDLSNISAEISSINAESDFEYGFGVMANAAILGGLGVQAELNLTKGKVNFSGVSSIGDKPVTNNYDTWLLDVPVMLWLNLDVWKLTVGFGGGVNMAFDLNSGSLAEMYSQTEALVKDNLFKMGAAAGADVKFFVTDSFALVVSGRWIMDFEKKTASFEIGEGLDLEYPTVEFQRNSVYGGIGVELKLL